MSEVVDSVVLFSYGLYFEYLERKQGLFMKLRKCPSTDVLALLDIQYI